MTAPGMITIIDTIIAHHFAITTPADSHFVPPPFAYSRHGRRRQNGSRFYTGAYVPRRHASQATYRVTTTTISMLHAAMRLR